MKSAPPGGQPTVRECLRRGSAVLRRAGVPGPELDAALLLAHALGRERAWLYAHPACRPQDRELALWRTLLKQRRRRRPLPYVTGRREFMGMDFRVDERVLIPRPETELLVELALQRLPHDRPAAAADVGTGSGCIAAALAARLPLLRMHALDVCAEALQVAAINFRTHGLEKRIVLCQSNLLSRLSTEVDLVIANPPYVSAAALADLDPEIRVYEPALALAGGKHGMDFLARLVEQCPAVLKNGGGLLLECGPDQAVPLRKLIAESGDFQSCRIHRDLAGLNRCVEAQGFACQRSRSVR